MLAIPRRLFSTAATKKPKSKVPEPTIPVTPVKLGRTGTILKMGIIGLPNSGRNSIFTVLHKYSFSEKNLKPGKTDARVPLQDSRFDRICSLYNPEQIVPAI
jgi:obg-like ATPase 1